MTPFLYSIMAEYNSWMNVRLYDAATKLSADDLMQDRGAFFGSLFGTLNHIAVADLIWLQRFSKHESLPTIAAALAGFPDPTTLTTPLAQSLPELTALRARIDALIIQFASLLGEPVLASTLHYSNVAGASQAKNFGLLLQHFFNHQTHHRGQASTLFSQAGIDIGVTDLNALIPSAV